jgi:hypothetical protein
MRFPILLLAVSLFSCGGATSSTPEAPGDDTSSASASDAGDGYEIRLSRESVVGRILRISVQDRRHTVVERTVDGETVGKDETVTLSAVAVHTVKKVNEDGRAVHSEYVIDKLTVTGEKGTQTVLEAGTVLNVHRAFDKTNTSADAGGKKLDEETLDVVDKLFTLELSQDGDDDIFGTTKRMVAGGKWTIDAAQVRASAAREGMPFILRDIEGGMTVLSESEVGGTKCLEIEGGFSAGIAAPQGRPGAADALSGKLAVKVWGMFPTDVTLPRLESRMNMTLSVKAIEEVEGKNVVTVTNVERVKTRAVELID